MTWLLFFFGTKPMGNILILKVGHRHQIKESKNKYYFINNFTFIQFEFLALNFLLKILLS